MIWLAFYTGRGRVYDRLVRTWTRSGFSHVEMLATPPLARTTRYSAISASQRDGGVRRKEIAFDLERWRLLPVEGWAREDALDKARAKIGAKYDWCGVLLSQTVAARRHAQDRWFCSELVAHALGLPAPHMLAPVDLWRWVSHLNLTYRAGYCDGRHVPGAISPRPPEQEKRQWPKR